jgi:hypothetical protein
MASVNYIEIDDTREIAKVDSQHITIEGADVLVGRVSKKSRVTKIEDYLGIGNQAIER